MNEPVRTPEAIWPVDHDAEVRRLKREIEKQERNGSRWIVGILVASYLIIAFTMLGYRDGFLTLEAENEALKEQVKLLQEERDSWACVTKKGVTHCIKSSGM